MPSPLRAPLPTITSLRTRSARSRATFCAIIEPIEKPRTSTSVRSSDGMDSHRAVRSFLFNNAGIASSSGEVPSTNCLRVSKKFSAPRWIRRAAPCRVRQCADRSCSRLWRCARPGPSTPRAASRSEPPRAAEGPTSRFETEALNAHFLIGTSLPGASGGRLERRQRLPLRRSGGAREPWCWRRPRPCARWRRSLRPIASAVEVRAEQRQIGDQIRHQADVREAVGV